MAELAPFRGLLFDPAKVDLARTLAPSSALDDGPTRAALVASAPHNVAPLIGVASDDERTAAAAELAAWQGSEALIQDPGRAIYRVVQTMPGPPGSLRPLVRRGVLAAVRLESMTDGRTGLPEHTVAGRVADRLATLRATGLQVETPLATYGDALGEVERLVRQAENRPSAVDVTTADGVRHQVWRVGDAELYGKIRRAMAAKKLMLLEGHHAYVAMLKHRDQLAAKAGPAGLSPYSSAQYGLTLLCASTDDGLILRPVHRVLHGVAGFDLHTFLARAAEFFAIDAVPGGGTAPAAATAALESTHAHQPAIVLAVPGKADAWRLTLDPHVDPRNHGILGHASVARQSTSLLHGLVLDHILGLNAVAQAKGGHLRYLTEPSAVLAALAAPGAQAAFYLGLPKIETLRLAVDVGDYLPAWSARIHPEVVAGLAMMAVDPDVDLL